ncbi:MAG TPA: hypothetical protein VFN56_01575 [Candidatus Saccharimonadales bacterium]|nr:hypothetical protein [Candidatus Saccharimonadales bacterium]
MALIESDPTLYQLQLKETRVQLSARLGELSLALCGGASLSREALQNVTVDLTSVLSELDAVNEELSSRWRYHVSVHPAAPNARCDECPLYDRADIVARITHPTQLI